MINKKAAVELSINFIVILIISIVIFSSGIALTLKFFKSVNEFKTSLDTKTDQAIEDSLRSSSVTVPFSNKNANRDEYRVYWLGVKNILKQDARFNFTVINLKAPIGTSEFLPVTYESSVFDLSDNQIHKVPIIVAVPKDANPGTYSYSVKVQFSTSITEPWEPYQSKNIYMNVK